MSFDSLPEEILPLIFDIKYFKHSKSQAAIHECILSISLVCRRFLFYGRRLSLHVLRISSVPGPRNHFIQKSLKSSSTSDSFSKHARVLHLFACDIKFSPFYPPFNEEAIQLELESVKLGYLKSCLRDFSNLKQLILEREPRLNFTIFCLRHLSSKSLKSVEYVGVRNSRSGVEVPLLMDALFIHKELVSLTVTDPPLGKVDVYVEPLTPYVLPILPLRSLEINGEVLWETSWTNILIDSSYRTLRTLNLNTHSGHHLKSTILNKTFFPVLNSLQLNLFSSNPVEIHSFVSAVISILKLQTGITELRIMSRGSVITSEEEIGIFSSVPTGLTYFRSNFIACNQNLVSSWRKGGFKNVHEFWLFVNNEQKWVDFYFMKERVNCEGGGSVEEITNLVENVL